MGSDFAAGAEDVNPMSSENSALPVNAAGCGVCAMFWGTAGFSSALSLMMASGCFSAIEVSMTSTNLCGSHTQPVSFTTDTVLPVP